MNKRIAITALLALAGLVAGACDPAVMLCQEAAAIHSERCSNGVQESCDWLAQNFPPNGNCAG